MKNCMVKHLKEAVFVEQYCCEVEPENVPDLVAVVRCNECVHWDELTQACDEIDGIFLPDWFCADGVRKEV